MNRNMYHLVYFIGLVCLLVNGGQCELTWENVYTRLSLRIEDIVFDIKSKENSMMKQVQDVISMVTATNEKLATFENRLSEVADCSAKSVVVEQRSFNIETYMKEIAEAEVGRRTHLLKRGLEQEKATTMTRFESLRKNQEKILLRTDNIERFQGVIMTRADDIDSRLNETRLQISNVENELYVTVYNTSTLFASVDTLKNTQVAMKGTEEKISALIAVIEEEVMSTQRSVHTLQSQVQNLVDKQGSLQSKTRTIEAQVATTRADISRLTEDKTGALVAVISEEVKSTQRNLTTLESQVQTIVGTQADLQSKTRTIEAQVDTTRADILRLQRINSGKDCSEILSKGSPKFSGVYTITTPLTHTEILVYCDMETEGGGWTVFQKRFDGSEDFYRNFRDYENGFGSVHAEHWLGLKYVYEITSSGSYQLRVDILRSNGSKGYDVYGDFSLQPGTNYTLNIGSRLRSKNVDTSYSFSHVDGGEPAGNAFSTYDRDVTRYNCAARYEAGWWFNSCYTYINLNSLYRPGQSAVNVMAYDSRDCLAASTIMFKRV